MQPVAAQQVGAAARTRKGHAVGDELLQRGSISLVARVLPYDGFVGFHTERRQGLDLLARRTGDLARRVQVFDPYQPAAAQTARAQPAADRGDQRAEVQRPGRIPWSPDLTLSKAVQSAGGFSLYAKETKVTLTRDNKAYDFDVKLAQRQPLEDPRLFPGDSIQVPRSAF